MYFNINLKVIFHGVGKQYYCIVWFIICFIIHQHEIKIEFILKYIILFVIPIISNIIFLFIIIIIIICCQARSLLSCLRTNNINIMWQSKKHQGQTDQLERWYAAPHSISEIPGLLRFFSNFFSNIFVHFFEKYFII